MTIFNALQCWSSGAGLVLTALSPGTPLVQQPSAEPLRIDSPSGPAEGLLRAPAIPASRDRDAAALAAARHANDAIATEKLIIIV